MATRSETTVLVVDDNPAHRYAIVRELSRAGFRLVEARTGEETFRLAAQASAIVLHPCRPDMARRDAPRRLRPSPPTAATPIVHHSSIYITEQDRLESERSGADMFLASPLPPGVLAEALDRLLDRPAAG